jgi:FkbM family methyltransferase
MYSQNNEEEIILNYFQNRKGHFLDLGANDGITLSNTHQLALNGWSGVCVEPSPKAFNKLKELYKNNSLIECLEVAISNVKGKMILHESDEHLGKGDVSLVSTLIFSETERWKGTQNFTEIEVNTITIKDLIETVTNNNFDFISIDCEGVDYEILETIDLNKVNCKLICIETNSKEVEKYISYISKFGFKVIYTNAENLIMGK